jgi:hypothetical protein
LNLNNFKIIEAVGLKIIASRSPWVALSSYQISWNLPLGSKVISGGQTDKQKHRQTSDLISLI